MISTILMSSSELWQGYLSLIAIIIVLTATNKLYLPWTWRIAIQHTRWKQKVTANWTLQFSFLLQWKQFLKIWSRIYPFQDSFHRDKTEKKLHWYLEIMVTIFRKQFVFEIYLPMFINNCIFNCQLCQSNSQQLMLFYHMKI